MDIKIAEPLIDWIEYVEAKPGAVQYLKKILPADSAIIASGPPKTSFKTWFSFLMSASLTTGKKIELIEPMKSEPLNVLYLLEEGATKGTAERWRMLSRGHGLDLQGMRPYLHWSHRNGARIDDQRYLDNLMEYIAKHDIKLVVFDTLAQCFAGDENSARDAGVINRNIKALINAGVGTSVLYLHHTGKSVYGKEGILDRDYDEQLRGSSAFVGGYDVHLAFRRVGSKRDSPLRLNVCNKEDAGYFFGLDWWFDKIGLHEDGRDKRNARLTMREIVPGEVSDETLEMCEHALLPGTVYLKKDLRQLWEGLTNEEIDIAIKIMLEREILAEKGKGYMLWSLSPIAAQEGFDG